MSLSIIPAQHRREAYCQQHQRIRTVTKVRSSTRLSTNTFAYHTLVTLECGCDATIVVSDRNLEEMKVPA